MKNGYLFMKKSGNLSQKSDDKRPVLKQQVSQKKYCRYKYFESLPKYSLEQPAITVTSPKQVSKISEMKEERKKWVSDKNFINFVGGK